MRSFHRRIILCGCGALALTAALCVLQLGARQSAVTTENDAGGAGRWSAGFVASGNGETTGPVDGGERRSGISSIPDSWWILMPMLAVATALALYLGSTSAKLRGDLTRLRHGIRQLTSHHQSIDTEDFTFEELGECARELSNIADLMRREHGKLAEDASSDALTGLPNRRFLMKTLAREVAASTRMGWPLSFIMIDLDHFKALNDTYGHQAGDFMLKHVAERMASLVRRSDILARFGGEEFAVVLPRATLGQAAEIAEELRDALRCDPHVIDQQPVQVSASFGVAEMGHCGAFDAGTLLKAADLALYEAKGAGRDTVVTAPKATPREENAPDGDDLDPNDIAASYEPAAGNADSAIDADTMALMGSTFSILRVIPDAHRVARDTLQQITATLGCRRASLFMIDATGGGLALVASVGAPMYESEADQTASDDLVDWFAQVQGIDTVIEARSIDPAVTDIVTEEAAHRLLRLPLVAHRDLLGVVEITDLPGDLDITKRHRSLLSAVCLIGATALKTCTLFKEQENRWTALTEALCQVIEADDIYRRDHALRVGEVSVQIARYLGFANEDDLRVLKTAALVHDIGQVSVPKRILQKKGRLRNTERRIIEKHCRIGADLLEGIPDLDRLAWIVLHHHEHFDGHGYPNRLAGDEIPLESKIIAVAAAYDAMRSDRPYRKALSEVEAIASIQAASGTQFDPTVVAAFMQCLEQNAITALAEVHSNA